ncbi:hypothetical protein DFH28DRAFT_922978 [Melampsora americana]|nr:hypothetical protein DFH28DRAFT_922978 [Melampsora americana]
MDNHTRLRCDCVSSCEHVCYRRQNLVQSPLERLVKIALAEVSKRTSLDVRTSPSPPRPRRESDDGVIIPGARLAGVTIRVERQGAVGALSVSYPEPTTESIVVRLSNMLADFVF